MGCDRKGQVRCRIMNEKEVGRAVEMDRDSQVSRERGSCWQISQKGRSG
jgi:hypothetical protein